NFPNAFFIVAFDHEYVLELVKEKKIPYPSQFLDKIFQLDIDLPSFPPDVLKPKLFDFLKERKSEFQFLQLKDSIDLIDKEIGLHNILENLRECIRLVNSINQVFERKYSEIDVTDFVVLELIKLKDKSIYGEVRDALSFGSEIQYLEYPVPLIS